MAPTDSTQEEEGFTQEGFHKAPLRLARSLARSSASDPLRVRAKTLRDAFGDAHAVTFTLML